MLVQLYKILKMVSQLGKFLDLAHRLDFQKSKKFKKYFGNDSRQSLHIEHAPLFKTKVLSGKQTIYTPRWYVRYIP